MFLSRGVRVLVGTSTPGILLLCRPTLARVDRASSTAEGDSIIFLDAPASLRLSGGTDSSVTHERNVRTGVTNTDFRRVVLSVSGLQAP